MQREILKKTYKVILVAIVLIILLGVLAKVFNLEDKILKKIYPKTYEEYVENMQKSIMLILFWYSQS